MSFPRYKKYKPSGVEWLGDVPEHWEVKRLKHLVANENYAGIQTGPFGGMLTDVLYQEEGEFKVYGQENVLSGDFEKGIRWVGAERFEALSNYHANSGDLLFTRKGSIGGCCSFPAAARPGIIDSDTIRVSLNHEVISQAFLLLAFKFSQYQEVQIQMLKRGAILSGLNTGVLANLVILTPPLSEQTQIAAFLDRETAKIDELVAEQRRLMELLKEKRQAVISHAVTQGLNPKAPMKPSGVKWLGTIPKHWDVVQSRRLFRVRNEPARESDQQLTASQKYGMLFQSDFVELEGRRVVEIIKGTDSLRHAEPNDFVISLRSFQGGLEWCKLAGSITFHYVVLVPVKGVHEPFFAHLFKSLAYIQALRATTNLIRDGQDLRYSNFVQVDLPVVPLLEQAEIASYLDRETAKFDTLTAEAQRAIDLLQERRTALISAAVTGQIDVRPLSKKQPA